MKMVIAIMKIAIVQTEKSRPYAVIAAPLQKVQAPALEIAR